MQSYNIQDYSEQLEQLCVACKSQHKCKDKTKLCMFKKFAFNLAKMKHKRDTKKQLVCEKGCE